MNAARRVLGITVLVIAGEAVFALPFHVARFFRPTLLAGLGLGNTELGALFSAYGIVAALCYFPGGLLADRFAARRLMAASLLLTGGLGVGLAALPGLRTLLLIYAGFGLTTVLLFWAALIRATRRWGGAGRQGTAFGALDGGRGLFAAGLASLAAIPFAAAFHDPAAATADERVQALRAVLAVYVTATFLAAALVWWTIADEPDEPDAPHQRIDWPRIGAVLTDPRIGSQALIVLAAYCAYKGIDNYSLVLMHAYGVDEVEASQAMVRMAWLRPVAALAAGVLADRIRATRAAALCFALLLAGDCLLAGFVSADEIVWVSLAVTCAAAFGLRGVYFALIDEARVAPAITGTAVGLISMIGFLPEIFIAPVTGWLLDRSPGLAGHHHVFTLLTVVALGGLLASLSLARRLSRSPSPSDA